MRILNYLSLSDNITIYLTKGNYNIVCEKLDSNGKSQYDYFSVNKTGKMILESIDGTKTLKEFILMFIKQNLLTADDFDWIYKFLIEMNSRGVVVFTDAKSDKCKVLRVFGEDTLISPMHVTVEITEKCNLYCAHCYLNASCNRTTAINFEMFRNLVEQFKKNKVMSIEITGGEVFMNRDADRILKYAFDNFARVAVLTNGTILKSTSLEILKTNKDKLAVSISLDSTEEKLHDKFRGAKGAFKSTCRNIKKLSDSGIFVRVASSIFKDNMWEIDKLAELALQLGAKVFAYNFIEDFGRGVVFSNKNKIDFTEQYSDYLVNTVLKYKDIIPIIETDEFLKTSSNCGAGTNSILVGADGNLRPCALFPKNTIFGNIFESNMEDIFSSETYQKLSEILPPSSQNGCPESCPKYNQCFGCYMKGLEANLNNDKYSYCPWVKYNELEKFMNYYKQGRLSYNG